MHVYWPSVISNAQLWSDTNQQPIGREIRRHKCGCLWHFFRKPLDDITRKVIDRDYRGRTCLRTTITPLETQNLTLTIQTPYIIERSQTLRWWWSSLESICCCCMLLRGVNGTFFIILLIVLINLPKRTVWLSNIIRLRKRIQIFLQPKLHCINSNANGKYGSHVGKYCVQMWYKTSQQITEEQNFPLQLQVCDTHS